MRCYVFWLFAITLSFLVSCSSNEPGGIRLLYTWSDEEGNEVTPPDLSLLFAWAELSYGSEKKTTGPAWMGEEGSVLRFDSLPYGKAMKLTLTLRFGEAQGDDDIVGAEDAPEARQDNVAFYCTSEEFTLKRGKVTEVKNGCVMQKGPAFSDENKPGAPVLTLYYEDAEGKEVEIGAATEFKTPKSRVTIVFTAPNDNFDTVIVANDPNFSTGRRELPKPQKESDGTYRITEYDLNEGLSVTGDGPRTIALKLRNALGFESLQANQTVSLDTTAPTPSVTPFPAVAKIGDIIEVRFSFDEEVLPEALELNWRWLEFTLVENKANRSYTFAHTVTADDPESTADFTLRATDLVGNATDYMALGSVRVDRTPPQVTEWNITKNDEEVVGGIYLKDKDVLGLLTVFSEPLGALPRARLGLYDLVCEEVEEAENTYFCQVTIDKSIHADAITDLSLSFKDEAGNDAVHTVETGIRIDNTPPYLGFKKNKEGDYNATEQIVLTITASEELSAITVNGVAQNPELLTWTVVGENTHGIHTVTASAVDKAGNELAETSIGVYVVDAIYPTATVELPIPTRISGTGSTVVAVNNVSEMVTYLTLNGVACTGNGYYTCTYTAAEGSGDEIVPLSVSLSDLAGNVTTLSAGTVYVDRTAPTLAVDLNKVAFNANDTIRITVTSSEEIDGVPVTEIPKASITLTNPTQISSFSWLYTLDPTLLSDDDYTVETSAIDKVGYSGVDSADFSVDSSVPNLVTASIDRAKAGMGITYTVDFTVSEPVVGGVPEVKANGIALSCAQNGGNTVFRCTRTVGAEESDGTVYSVSTTLSDAAGNSRAVTLGSVLVDKTLPGAVAGTATLSIDAGTDCDLPQEQVTTIADGSKVYLSLQVSEKLADGYTPTLVAKKAGAPDRVFDLDAQSGLTYYFSYTYDEDNPAAEMIGTYSLELTLKDEAGNEATVTVTPDKPFTVGWNTPTLIVNQSAVSYTRSPWGRPTPYDIKDGTGNTVYTIPANEYYEIGPNDLYEATDRLPADTFTLDYGSTTGTPVRLKAYDENGSEIKMIPNTPNGDGSWPRLRVWSYNSPSVRVSAVDSSCRKTDPVTIENANWIATMNRKVPGDLSKNQNQFLGSEMFSEKVLIPRRGAYEVSEGGISLIEKRGTGRGWHQWIDNALDGPSARFGHNLVYDPIRGRMVLFGGMSVSVTGGTYSNETWEWNEGKWVKKDPAGMPSVRYFAAMAYDSARGKVVLFGGYTGSFNDETWTWNGEEWSKMSPVNKPSGRESPAMAYDVLRGEVVLFGGRTGSDSHSDETWAWDGVNWTLLSPATKPSARGGHAMVYDSTAGTILLFGGQTAPGSAGYSNETWQWDGASWRLLTPSNAPSPRSCHAMAYDRGRNKVVVFGGHTGSFNNETWEWDGNTWSQQFSTIMPSPLCGASLAYHAERGSVLLFGGYNASGYSAETWEWDGKNWRRLHLGEKPVARNNPAMTYDSDRERIVLFGGISYASFPPVVLDDTWEWDGANWIPLSPADHPSARTYTAMVYDRERKKALLFGGSSGSDETWEWDGTNWELKNPSTKPAGRDQHAMVYDRLHQKVVLFGGWVSSVPSAETWEWDGKEWELKQPKTVPSGRVLSAMTYEESYNRVLMYGGYMGGGQGSTETWVWDGEEWSLLNPPAHPNARYEMPLAYDPLRKEAIMMGGRYASLNEMWKWNGTTWRRSYPVVLPPVGTASALVFADKWGEEVLFGGGTDSASFDETWLWSGGGNDRAAQIMYVSWESAGVTDDTQIESVSVFFNAGGLGDITGTPVNGVDLLTWKHDRWVKVASNTAGPDDLAPVTWATTDNTEIQTLLNSGLRQFNFAVAPTAPNGFLTDMGKVATDYAEVIVRYSIQ